MGCGQSKINIYPRKAKGKNSNKKSVSGDKPEGDDDEGAENEQDTIEEQENIEEDGKKKPARTKTVHVGGPLLAQTGCKIGSATNIMELSSSQQNFFKMLDEKIENGPDYDSNDETEIALETARLHTLLKDWETASASSRSLPPTPRHIPRPQERPVHSAPKPHTRIPPNVIHQSYGVTPPANYRQTPNYNYQHSPPHQYVQKMQYQHQHEYSQSYQQNYMPRHYQPSVPVQTSSPIHYQPNNSPKKYPQIYNVQNSPPHKIYVPQPQGYTNGELIIQQQLYNQQLQYQQSREYQQYRQSREQLLVQQQICGSSGLPPSIPTLPLPPSIPSGITGYGPPRGTHYQSSVHVPIVAVLPQNEQSPKMSLQRKQRQYSQEMT